ncbi:MAG: response regulator transcription factor [Planctomycetes bacterium]|nr:response regulator transcription factor [Planctomycetota bacterium]
MLEFPNPVSKNIIAEDDSLYKHPEVMLLNKEQWSYIKRRYRISARELEVAKLICRGFSNKEITNDLGIALGTVKTHLRNIYRRVHVKNKITLLLRFMDDIDKLFGQSG